MTLGLDFVPTPTREGFRDDDDDDRTRARDEREREREDAASASTRARGRSVNRLAGEMATRAVTGAMRIHACEGRSVRLRKMTTTTMTVRGGRGERAGSSARRTPSVVTRAVKRVFIDGEAGTTGLQVRERLQARSDIELIQLDESKRKDLDARKKALNECDAAILCLPDAAAIEAVKLVENDTTVVIDASTAFRIADGWTYGFPELAPGHRDKVKTSKRISNPGCYPTGFIALTRPLVDAGILSPDTALTVNAVSGYTGGGKALIKVYEEEEHEPWGAYGFNLEHKHLPEMAKWSMLGREPIFMPSVGSFAQGMVVSVPLHYEQLNEVGRSAERLQACLSERYADGTYVSVRDLNRMDDLERGAFMRPDSLANTNKLELSVYANDVKRTAVLVARLDNLGKGASGAAVQNMNLALGLEETSGL
jgi:N-acetyl-gamma-glutamyl-phosphate reductase|tara:strand:- start:521 stop:1792 length:1272 start_codon:yes stop_codon:yes gene_type:complete